MKAQKLNNMMKMCHYLHIKVMMKWWQVIRTSRHEVVQSSLWSVKLLYTTSPVSPRPASWLLTRDVGQSMNAETVLSPPVPRCRPRPRVLLLQITNVIICVGREMVWKDGDGEKLLVTRHSAQTSGHASLNMDNILPVIISTFYVHSNMHPYLRIITSSHLWMLYTYLLEFPYKYSGLCRINFISNLNLAVQSFKIIYLIIIYANCLQT